MATTDILIKEIEAFALFNAIKDKLVHLDINVTVI